MANIITPQRFKSQYTLFKERYKELQQKFPEDKKFKKIGRTIVLMRSAYLRDKVYAVKYLNTLENFQASFDEERRALVVQGIELMQKVILHKKLNKNKTSSRKSQ